MLLLANELMANPSRTFLECGSGSSTVWLALVIEQLDLGSRIVALEHQEQFATATRRELRRHGLEDVAEVRVAPLRPVEDLADHETPWYDKRLIEDLDDIGLVFVDGPPGNTGRLARLPAAPLLRERLADRCVIVVDDAGRDDERTVIQEWRKWLPDFVVEEVDAEKGAVVFRRGAPDIDDWTGEAKVLQAARARS
jgi:predicted O-methyltransferase YrrM